MLGSTWAPVCIVLASVFRTCAFLRSSRGASETTAAEKSKGFFFDYHLHGQDWHAGMCNSRERQSPIDFDRDAPWGCQVGLTPPVKCDNGPLDFSYMPVIAGKTFEMQNNGKSLAADFALQGYGGITYNDKWFNLMSVNFHSGSEHTFRGRQYPLELHYVHKQYDSPHILVVAVPFNCPGAEAHYKATHPPALSLQQQNQTQKRLPEFHFLGTTADEAAEQEQEDESYKAEVGDVLREQQSQSIQMIKSKKTDPGFNPTLEVYLSQGLPGKGKKLDVAVQTETDILNPFLEGGTYFEYRGSLTAPPCAEQVTWMVRREPLMASDHQADLIHDNIYQANMDYGNYRSVMPLMGRGIKVRKGFKNEPIATVNGPSGFDASKTRASDFGAIAEGRRAAAAAKEASTMARAVDDTLSRAAQAHANKLPASDIFKPPPAEHALDEIFPTPDPHQLLSSIGNAVADQAMQALGNAVIAAAASVPTVPPLPPTVGR